MKNNRILLALGACGLSMAALTQSCVSDMPFADGEGTGTLRMQLVVNSDLTRAELSEEDLLESCKVYVSGSQGLLYKYEGAANLPEELPLKSGNYVAEAWTGDSVPASFTSRFYRGYQAFTIENQSKKAIVINCKIANVVVSIDPTTVNPELMSDWKMTVSNSSGSLVFDQNNIDTDKGYFMMPNRDIAVDSETGEQRRDDKGWPYYTNLTYTIEGTASNGKPFTKTGAIGTKTLGDDLVVERAHEYVLKLEYNPEYEKTGGSFITVKVDASEVLVQEEIGLFSRPSIKGVDFDIARQVVGNAGGFRDVMVKIGGFKGLKNIVVSSDNPSALNLPYGRFDIMDLAPGVEDEIKPCGIDWDYTQKDDDKPSVCYLTFSADFLNRLVESNDEYKINLYVVDGHGRVNEADLCIAVGAGAIRKEIPLTLNDVTKSGNLLDLRATSALITGTLDSDDASAAEIYYRLAGTQDAWSKKAIAVTRSGAAFSAQLTGLQPGARYEYKAVLGEAESDLFYFTTEEKYKIPNGDLEQWTTEGKGWALAAPNTNDVFWNSGNNGSSTLKVTNICEPTQEKRHGGQYAAKLSTLTVASQLAAGNLFAGQFGSASVMPLGAKLTFGRPYNGSHPESMNVWVHYTPAVMTKKDTSKVPTEKDHGQIYVAFTDNTVSISTGDKQYFDPNGDPQRNFQVLGYGEVTWEGVDYGDGADLKLVNIPVKWNDKARTVKPTHIVIVCSASKYGDYFVGGAGSVMYVDDFELVY